MSSVYTPTAVALGNITIPSDGDARNAASINVPLQAIADGVAFSSPRVDILTAASGNWTVPAGVTLIEIHAYAGGGSGGAGGGGDTTTPTTRTALGGGGGGGSKKTITRMIVTPAAVLAYVNGAGGASRAGPPAANAGTQGFDGADSTLNGVTVARGGGGGNSSQSAWTTTANVFPAALGGKCARTAAGPVQARQYTTFATSPAPETEPCNGGQGAGGGSSITQDATAGGCSPEGFAGGAAGVIGVTNTNLGGGSGGGGGAGPGGAGGAAGSGGAGSAAGTGTVGAAGSSAAANTGAGGGGGGGGGQGAVAGGAGGASGAGGSGKMWIVYNGPQAVFT